MRPRLAIIVSTYSRQSRFIEREIAGLRARGLAVDVFALRRDPDDRDAPSGEAPGPLCLPYICSREVLGANLAWAVRRPGRYFGALARLVAGHLRSPWVLAKAVVAFPKAAAYARRIGAGGYRRVHAHWAGIAATAAFAVHRLTGLPYSFTGHAWDLYNDDEMLGEKVRAAEFVVTCTDHNRAALERRFPEAAANKVRLSYHGLDLDRYAFHAPGPASVPWRLLAIGKRTAKKGFDDLLRASALLVAGGAELSVRIVGWPGDLDAALAAIARDEGLAGRVTIEDYVEEDRLLEVYRAADCLVAPSVVLEGRLLDGIPNVLLEAMALGVPVVATAVSGIPEVVRDGETGLLVPPRNPDALARAIGWALTDRAGAATRAVAARRLMEERFDLRRNTAELAALHLGGPARRNAAG
jgi:colanic acid/amylovoran biosynthesis glycosyltransferase